MMNSSYATLSDVIETYDMDETKRLLDSQLEAIHNDSCEGMIDNFKILFKRYAELRDNPETREPDTFEEIERRFFEICNMYILHITDSVGISVDDMYLESHYQDLPSIALQFYLFFVLDLYSNMFNVLLTFIARNTSLLASQFETMRQRRDSITEVNRSMEDQNVALIASNIYDVIDWVMDNMTPEVFFDSMEPGYIALEPMKRMYEENVIDGGFIDGLRDIMKYNINLKARVGFDIICRLKGFNLNA